ncbi:MAG: serine/threonine protein kinase [Actinobacteria bacterium]|nr:serine/threonine protein kinase [Actinomycetota bacterium]
MTAETTFDDDTAALDPQPGLVLADGRYRLDELIGSGGMATVWRATDRRLQRPVAVKLISEANAGVSSSKVDRTYAARFAREARIAAGLSHPNLVGVYDYGADGRRPYLVMEYVDGGTLAERLDRGPVIGPDAAAVAGDLLAALACIHAAGILHRDIKPANVLLSTDGRARITDFGIAQPADSTSLTQTGHLVGTLRYLAPEVIDGQPASARSDLYSLGVLLRDLAAGRPDPTTEQLVTRLTDRLPSRRPASADHARRLIGPPSGRRRGPSGRSAGTGRPPPSPATRRPRTSAAPDRHARPAAAAPCRRRVRLVRKIVILAAVGAVLGLAVVLIPGTRRTPAPIHASKPGLVNRIDELDRLIRAAGPRY